MILVTGAKGFIGRHLCARLNGMEHKFLSLDYAAKVNISGQELECDLTSLDHIAELKNVLPVPETIIHLAGYVEIAFRADPRASNAPPLPGKENVSKLYNVNVGATANLLDYCLNTGVKHLIFSSSQSVYGMPQSCPLTEQTLCEPLEHYAMSKLCCERILWTGARQGLAVTILRFPGVFSEERRSGVVFQFCQQAIRLGEIRVKADYPLPLDVIHLEDVVDACLKAASWGGHEGGVCLNIATGEPCSLNLLAEAVAALVPKCRVMLAEIPQPIVQMDSKRAETILSWKAQPQRLRLAAMLRSVTHAC